MTKSELNISFEEFGKYTVLSLSGRIRQPDYKRIRAAVDIIINNGTKCIVFDIENLENITSLAISALIRVSKLVEIFCVYNINNHTAEVFERLGLQHIFRIYKTKKDFMFDRRKLGLI